LPRVSLVTTQVAPFQVEFAQAVNALEGFEYRVIFTQAENARPRHWLDLGDAISDTSRIAPSETAAHPARIAWTIEQLSALRPDVILVGGVRGPHVDAALAYRDRHVRNVPIGLWMEPPLRNTNPVHQTGRRLDYLRRLRRADFVLAIGDRAHAYYRGCNANTHFVPYGADLSRCLEAPLPKPRGDRVKFLFSGGLHPRHNFPLIMEGFKSLLSSRGPCFEFIVSGDGPEQAVIDAAVAEMPALGEVIRYERTFETWTGRLDPFVEADVFVYPTAHAGWGLVIPEAMAAGNLVITSSGAEAARYLITHDVDGVMIEPTKASFIAMLERCVDDRDWVERLGIAARVSAQRGHATYVAGQLRDALRIATGGRV